MPSSTGIKFNKNPPSIELVGCIIIHFTSENEIRITKSQNDSPSMLNGLDNEYLYKFNKDVNVDYSFKDGLFTIKLDGNDFMIYKLTNENFNIDNISQNLLIQDYIDIPIIDINTELYNIKHLISSTEYDKLDDLWD